MWANKLFLTHTPSIAPTAPAVGLTLRRCGHCFQGGDEAVGRLIEHERPRVRREVPKPLEPRLRESHRINRNYCNSLIPENIVFIHQTVGGTQENDHRYRRGGVRQTAAKSSSSKNHPKDPHWAELMKSCNQMKANPPGSEPTAHISEMCRYPGRGFTLARHGILAKPLAGLRTSALGGRKPSKAKRSVGSPTAQRAARSADAPGIAGSLP